MSMTDLFEPFRVPRKMRATWATRATSSRNTNDSKHLLDTVAVAHVAAHAGNKGNVRSDIAGATSEVEQAARLPGIDVAPLPSPGKTWVTPSGAETSKCDKHSPRSLPPLPMLPSEKNGLGAMARARALLSETFHRIAAWWVEGAELPASELEADIDRAILTGDLAALQATLSVYEQAARDNCAFAER